jgi:putative PIN family toxin of toxin-antitoxin system
MIVVIDSNIFLSALISPFGPPAKIFNAWLEGRFRVATCWEQIEELRSASRYPKFKEILKPHLVGKLLNTLHGSDIHRGIRKRHTADDPTDSYLLDLADIAGAHYLVTGDKKSGLLTHRKLGQTKILNAVSFCRYGLGERIT